MTDDNAARAEPISTHVFVVRDAATLKVVSAPLRLRLLERLRGEARTAKELARELGLPTTRLYYHLKLLEEHGLIRVVETRLVSGILEKRYRATAGRLAIDRALLGSDADTDSDTDTGTDTDTDAEAADGPLETMLAAILDGTREGVRQSVAAGLVDPRLESPREGGLLLGRKWLRLSQEQAGDLYDRLLRLVAEFDRDAPLAPGDGLAYELLLGFYPMHLPELDSREPAPDAPAPVTGNHAGDGRRHNDGDARESAS